MSQNNLSQRSPGWLCRHLSYVGGDVSCAGIVAPHEQYPLPPREIVSEVADKTGVEEVEAGPDPGIATTVAHFAYGAATGALYAALPPRMELPWAWPPRSLSSRTSSRRLLNTSNF